MQIRPFWPDSTLSSKDRCSKNHRNSSSLSVTNREVTKVTKRKTKSWKSKCTQISSYFCCGTHLVRRKTFPLTTSAHKSIWTDSQQGCRKTSTNQTFYKWLLMRLLVVKVNWKLQLSRLYKKSENNCLPVCPASSEVSKCYCKICETVPSASTETTLKCSSKSPSKTLTRLVCTPSVLTLMR